MASNATIFKTTLQIADMDRNYYADHALTIARHPSETDERMMVRVLAFVRHAHPALEFRRGLSAADAFNMAHSEQHRCGQRSALKPVAAPATVVAEMSTKPATDLGTLFFGAYRRQVLGLLLLHPDESFHLREIARVTNTQPGTLRRELAQLTDAGVLSRESIGNLVRYKADATCPIYDELRGILKKTAGMADVLRAALAPLGDKISVAFVFGSVARGGERRASDIDVMVVGSVSFEEVVGALHSSQKELRREINPSVYSLAEFKKKAAERGSFVARVLREPKLFIQGTERDVRKLAANRKAKAA